jgi:hypothetical protein
MNTKLMLLVSVFAATIFAAANVAKADGVRGAAAKILGDYGDAPRSSVYRSAPMVRESAPTTRSFSYSPAQQPAAAAPVAPSAKPSAPPATAQRGTTSQRRFSYQPATPSSGPMMSRRYSLPTDAYLLPKTDSRKYGGN